MGNGVFLIHQKLMMHTKIGFLTDNIEETAKQQWHKV